MKRQLLWTQSSAHLCQEQKGGGEKKNLHSLIEFLAKVSVGRLAVPTSGVNWQNSVRLGKLMSFCKFFFDWGSDIITCLHYAR